LINAGLYHLKSDLFQNWDGQAFSMERELFPAMVRANKLAAVALKTDFIDIGIPEDYYRFCRWIKSQKTEIL
jgi:D-glycero-alpha-D-manno-heptose 1-phosphate guanylyltransferase